MRKKLFLPLILAFLLLFSRVSPVLAECDLLDVGCHWNKFVDEKITAAKNLFSFQNNIGLSLITMMFNMLTNIDLTGQQPVTAQALQTSALAMVNSTAVHLAANPPPLKPEYDFKATLANNILVPRETLAAITGKDFLAGGSAVDNFYDLWKKLRNIAYAFLILVVVLVGIMVMMRYNIDPRTTATALEFIPNLVTSLVLITFSWVISGLFVDLSIILVKLVTNTFGEVQNWEVFFGPTWGAIVSWWNTVARAATFDLSNPAEWVGAVINTGVSIVGGGIATILFALIMIIASFIVTLMLVFELSKRWITLVILSMASPLAFLWGTIPGQEDTIKTWFKSMLVAALTFPAVQALMVISWKLALLDYSTTIPNTLPYIGGGSFPWFNAIISIGTLMMALKVSAVIEDLLDVKAPAGLQRAGIGAGKLASNLPFVGGMFK